MTRSIRAHGRGLKTTRGRVVQDIVTGAKRGFKIQIQGIVQARGGAKAALPLPHAHVDCPNIELPVKPPPCLEKISLLQFTRNP